MAAFTTGASTMDITPNGAVLNATGEVFKLYGAHFGAGMIPVDLTGNAPQPDPKYPVGRSEEHTSELQSLMRISYAVFCLKKKRRSTSNKFNVTQSSTSQQPQRCISI